MKFLQRNTVVYTKKIKGKWYILENNKKTMRELNDVASTIWGLLRTKRSIDALVSSVCKEYSVRPAIAKKDILSFIRHYVKEGYIKEVSS